MVKSKELISSSGSEGEVAVASSVREKVVISSSDEEAEAGGDLIISTETEKVAEGVAKKAGERSEDEGMGDVFEFLAMEN